MSDSLSLLFGSEVRAKLLRTLFSQPDQAYHLRGLAAAAGVDSGNASKTLKALARTHLVRLITDSRGTLYQAEDQSPWFRPLRELFLVSGELLNDLKDVATKLPADQVLVFGSVAKGVDGPGSDVDILVIGKLSSVEAQAAFNRIGRKHRRPVNVMVVDRRKLSKQVAEGSAFWRDILAGKIIMLKGEPLDVEIAARV
ncbi:MAG: nucleotidyltransferase domain-containing protein [Burkholderiaceae bacterium]|nr:nucleotidyltransferase domain-containing protein [Burkholderiaceae bacterium]